MAYAPDYGLAMLQSGFEEDATISFSPFQISHISMLSDGNFSTSVNVPIGETDHALTADFSPDTLGEILSLSSDDTVQLVFDWLKSNPVNDTLELPEPIILDITLAFGELQSNEDESYLPLIIQEVLSPYELLDQYQGDDDK